MGDGKKIKDILDSKGIKISTLAKHTGIPATTIYTLVQRDSNLRFDYALRIANELDIEPSEICSASPFSGELEEDDVYWTIKDSKGILDKSRVKTYVKSSLMPLMELYGKVGILEVDQFLTDFYQLDDESRTEVIDIIKLKLKNHRDPERAKEIKQIKWKK